MPNNFRKTAVLKKNICISNSSYTAKEFTNNFWGSLLCLNFFRRLLWIFHIFVCNFSREISVGRNTGCPSSLQELGRDSCLRALLCYKWLFTKAYMGCKRFFLKEGKSVYMFLNKNRLPLLPCCIVCCLSASHAVLKRFRRVSAILVFHNKEYNKAIRQVDFI